MEDFKVKLKLDIFVIVLCVCVLTLFIILAAAAEAGVVPFPTPTAGDIHWQSMWRGFISGASCGILGVLIAYLVRNLMALRDEKKLKKLYIKETDERSIQIWSAARVAAYRTFLILGLVAAIIAGYFSIAVSVTIICCVFIASVIGGLYAVYYSIKF